jgi:hypothetical protein
MQVIGVFISVFFAFGGRWILLHPERLVSKGQFTGPDSPGARLYRIQALVVGTGMVFGGTSMAVSSLASLLSFGSAVMLWMGSLLGIAAGVIAAMHVHKEAKARPPYVSNSPYGWWP